MVRHSKYRVFRKAPAVKMKLASTLAVVAAAGAVFVGPLAGSATAAVPGAQFPAHQDGDWGGWNRPGWHDPRDPFRNDWHCDRHGVWHNDEHDQWGHSDGRCRPW
jgi:hypothetical protein